MGKKKEENNVFTDTLLSTYDAIVEWYENTRIPKPIRNWYIKWMINKTIKTYRRAVNNIDLNYPVMHDFARFYLNTEGGVNYAFNYNLVANNKGFIKIIIGHEFVKVFFKKNKSKYEITFRSNGEIEINHTENTIPGDIRNTTSIMYLVTQKIDDKELEKYIKDEILIYIGYFLRTYCF